MKKQILLILTLLFSSCLGPKHYDVSIVINNQTGYDIEIFKDDEYYATSNNDDACEIIRGKCPYDIDNTGFNIDKIIKQNKKISFWKIEGDYATFLKEWTYDNRNEPGKQLFRTSDYTQKMTITYIEGNPLITDYQFSITIYPEDIL